MAVVAVADDRLTFTQPVITPKHYVTKGPSGHTETFLRCDLDAELDQFLAPAPTSDMVDLFIATRELQEHKDPMTWHTVVGFIARTIGTSPLAVPPGCGVAFWGQIIIAMARAREAAN